MLLSGECGESYCDYVESGNRTGIPVTVLMTFQFLLHNFLTPDLIYLDFFDNLSLIKKNIILENEYEIIESILKS